jgi:hypothetical protein
MAMNTLDLCTQFVNTNVHVLHPEHSQLFMPIVYICMMYITLCSNDMGATLIHDYIHTKINIINL